MTKLIYITLGLIILNSCTKIVDIELNSALQTIVVEARITDQDLPATVYLTRTTDYFNPEEPEKVTGAKVVISSSSGAQETLTEVSPGLYQTLELRGENNQEYYLRVEDGGQVYEASSFLPAKVSIDSLVYAPSFFGNPNETDPGFILTCWFTDPGERANYYNFKISKTSADTTQPAGRPRSSSSPILLNDINFNGRLSSFNLNRIGLYRTNDTVLVEFISIESKVYQYLDQLNEVLGGGFMLGNSAPANPETNLSNGAVGYFSAEAIDKRKIIIAPK